MLSQLPEVAQVEKVYNWLDAMARGIGIYARHTPEPWAISLRERLAEARAAAATPTEGE